MSARSEDAQRRWEPVRSPAMVTRGVERAPVPWAVVLERLHAAAASGELAARPPGDGLRERSATGRDERQAAEVRRRLLEAVARRARLGAA